MAVKKTVAKKKKIHVVEGRVYISATFNNAIITITDIEGKTVAWATAGSSGFKGTRKSTPYAGEMAAKAATEKAKVYGMEKVHIILKGVGPAREQAMRGINAGGLEVMSITDATPVPHNGCRKRRVRRV